MSLADSAQIMGHQYKSITEDVGRRRLWKMELFYFIMDSNIDQWM